MKLMVVYEGSGPVTNPEVPEGAIAAAKAGARRVLAADTDHFAADAIAMNAAVNEVQVTVTAAELIETADELWGVVTAGDVCYEQPMAERVTVWLHR